MNTPVRAAAMLLGTPSRGSPWAAGRTPASTRRSLLGSPSTLTPSKKDSLVKVTFKQTHDRAPPKSCMYIIGSLPSLGSWDAKKARRMHADEDGKGWTLSFYIPEKMEFLYQYFLADESVKRFDGSGEPMILWEGGLERKCQIVEAIGTPNKSILVSDDTRGEQPPLPEESTICGAVRMSLSGSEPPVVEKLASSTFSHVVELEGLEQQIGSLEQEREQVHQEIIKLRELVTLKIPAGEQEEEPYNARDSFITDAGSLYDTVKKIQAIIRTSNISLQPSAADLASLRAELESSRDSAVSELESRMVGAAEEAKQRHQGEVAELKEYYARTLEELDDNHKRIAEERACTEEAKMMLQMNVRVAAGEVQGIRELYGWLKEQAFSLRSTVILDLEAMRERIVDGVAAANVGMEAKVHLAVEKLQGETRERKRLHNMVQELKGNIRVFCRVRPGKDDEGSGAVHVSSEAELMLEASGKTNAFQYDRVFAPASSQEEVFQETEPLIVSVLDGYNVCIFAYGQTGSGKTHTMQGYGASPGVNVRALSALFDMAAERREVTSYKISVSLIEIYNEAIKDLVEPKDEAGEIKKLDVKNAPEGGTHVPGICVRQVLCMDDVEAVLSQGQKNRSVGSTNMNEQSSRSHMVLTIYVHSTAVRTGAVSHGKMHLIDLAGSERIGKSGAEGTRLKEAQNINKSLSALGDCVQALVAKSKHVPFRNSKLTYLLQDSLGGDSKALMFVCVSPGESDAPETLCSLNFAARVRNVELGQAKRKGDGGADVRLRERERDLEAAKDEAKRERAEADKLRARLAEMKRDAEDLQIAADAAKRDAASAKRDAEKAADAARMDAEKAIADAAKKSSALAPAAAATAPALAEPASRTKPLVVSAPEETRPESEGAASTPPSAQLGKENGGGEPEGGEAVDPRDAPAPAKSSTPLTPQKADNSMTGLTLDEKLSRHRAQKKAALLAANSDAPAREGREPGSGILKHASSERPQSAPPSRLGVSRRGGIGGPARVISKPSERKATALERASSTSTASSSSLTNGSRIPRR